MIKPGEKGRIRLSVKVYEDQAGRRVTKRALVETNDVQHRKFILSLSAMVDGEPDLWKSDPNPGSSPLQFSPQPTGEGA